MGNTYSENFHYKQYAIQQFPVHCALWYKIKMDQQIYWENSYQQILSIGVNMKPTAMEKQILIYKAYGLILWRVLVLQKLWCSNIKFFGPRSPTRHPESHFKSTTLLRRTWSLENSQHSVPWPQHKLTRINQGKKWSLSQIWNPASL